MDKKLTIEMRLEEWKKLEYLLWEFESKYCTSVIWAEEQQTIQAFRDAFAAALLQVRPKN